MRRFGRLDDRIRDDARVLFSTHSLPLAMAETSGPSGGAYIAQHRTVADAVARGVAERTGRTPEWDLVFQSRSGPPSQPWLEPDVSDHLRVLADKGVPGVVVVPIGFVSDHMEVVHDLDTEAAARGRGDRPAVRPGGDPWACTRRSSRWCATWCSNESSAARMRGPAASHSCCPNPRAAGLPVVAQC